MLKISSLKEAAEFGEMGYGSERILPTNYPNINQFLQSFNQLKKYLGPQLKFFRTIGKYEQQLKDLVDGKIENFKGRGLAAMTPEGSWHSGRVLMQQLDRQFQAINGQIQSMLNGEVQDTDTMKNIENYLVRVLAPLQAQATEQAEVQQVQQEIDAMPATPQAKTNPYTGELHSTPAEQISAINQMQQEEPIDPEKPIARRTWKNKMEDRYRDWRKRQKDRGTYDKNTAPAYANSENKIITASWASEVFGY